MRSEYYNCSLTVENPISNIKAIKELALRHGWKFIDASPFFNGEEMEKHYFLGRTYPRSVLKSDVLFEINRMIKYLKAIPGVRIMEKRAELVILEDRLRKRN